MVRDSENSRPKKEEPSLDQADSIQMKAVTKILNSCSLGYWNLDSWGPA